MAGPWEAYQTSSAPAKPWEAYQSKPVMDNGLTTGSKFADKTLDVLGGPTYATNEAIYHGKESGNILKQGVKDIPRDLANREKQDWQGVKQAFEDTGKAAGPASGMYNAGKTALRAIAMPFEPMNVSLENTYGRMAQAGAVHQGRDIKPEEAAIVPEVMLPGGIGGKAKSIPKAIAADEATAVAAGRMGVTPEVLAKVKNPDLMKGALQGAAAKTKEGVVAATGGKPLSDEALTQQAVRTLSEKYESLKDAKNAAYEQAKKAGLATPVDEVSNIGVLRHIVGQTEEAPEGYTAGFANPRSDKTMPREVNTAKDLIDMRQSLNKKMTAETQKPITSPLVYDDLKEKITQVNAALDEAKAKNPDFGKTLDAADAQHRLIKETYGGEIAKQLGLDENLFKAMRSAKTAGAKGDTKLSQAAFDNAVASTRGLIPAIKTPEQLRLLKNGMSRDGFKDVLYKKVSDISADVGEDADKLRKARPLLNHMLETSGVKGQKAVRALDDMQTVFDKYKAEGINTNIPSAAYRTGKSGYIKSVVKSLWGVVLAALGHPLWGAAEGVGAAKGLAAQEAGRAKALMDLRGQLLPKSPVSIPGEAIGATLGGNASYQDQK